jgi:glutamate dehydrogenase
MREEMAENADIFVRAFYAILPAEDLTAAGPKKLSAIALALWRFMQNRPAGSLKLRLFNPSQGVDGWQSPHTVVAMLNDDMPFIIDSVTAYLTAQHLTIHRLIHPVLRVGRDSSGALGDLHDAARNGGA